MAPLARALATLKELARVLVDENDNVLGGGNPIQVGGTITTTPSGTTTVAGTVAVSSVAGGVDLDDGLAASRAGNGVCGWANEVTPGADQVVLTTAGLIYNIASGKRVMVTQYCYAVETASDSCQFEFGYTSEAGGAGTFSGLGPHKHVYTGAANTGRTAYDQDISPPAVISYAAGARCVTFRVDANDAACEVTVGWHGWVEDE